MAEDSKIEWCDDTVNPWVGCARVSPACTHCYAEGMDARFKFGGATNWGPGAPRFIRVARAIATLRTIADRSDREGRRRRVFLASMADLFEDRDDLVEPRKRLWDELHRLAGDAPRITPLLLTKRPEVMAAWAAEHGWPAGCAAGTTAEDQRRLDERIVHLVKVPARVRFLSMEPLLEAVDLRLERCTSCGGSGGRPGGWPHDGLDVDCGECDGRGWWQSHPDGRHTLTRLIDWVIAGGESGPHARPMHPDWARFIRDQCEAAGVPFFFKQWGEWVPDQPQPGQSDAPGSGWWAMRADGSRPSGPADSGVQWMRRAGKKKAGRLLDGRTHDGVPDVW